MNKYTHTITVDSSVIDTNLHVNNVAYIQWMQDAALAHSQYVGDTLQMQKKRNYAWVAKTHTIDYLAPAYENELLHVKTWVEKYKKSACIRKYEFFNENITLLARAHTIYVCIDATSKRPIKIPEDIYSVYLQ